MYKVKIFGAGSIGNHLANASRAQGWSVDIVDLDEDALGRTKNDIYPSRYGAWDPEIGLYTSSNAPVGGYDLIFIGTPPDSHIPLALQAIDEKPRAILIEKPICGPDLDGAQELVEKAAAAGVACFVGYDHVVGEASVKASEMIRANVVGDVATLDVENREHWGGIFAAHPWLDGPKDSYLGFWRRGGGACGEHSHGLNLWQHFAHELGAGRVVEVTATMEYYKDGETDFDKICLANLKAENGMIGRVVQDVVTFPARKWARVQGVDGAIDWYCGYKPGVDAVLSSLRGHERVEHLYPKTRPDDFKMELRHIASALESDPSGSPLSLTRGLDTMLVIAAAHKSAQEGRTVHIDYSKGYASAALV